MSNFIHRFLNPHCPDCALDRSEESACNSCETLRQQLMQSNLEKKELLHRIMELTSPVKQVEMEEVKIEEFKPKFVPWSVRRTELERVDRENARQMKVRQDEINANLKAADKQKVDTSELEREMDIIRDEKEKQNAS